MKPEQDAKGRFIPGNNGGNGRPKGARNKLGEDFLEALLSIRDLARQRSYGGFKLVMAASKTWRRLKGENHLPMVIAGGKFTNGVAVTLSRKRP